MLVIRPEQLEVFQRVANRDFEERLRRHLQRIWPETCLMLGAVEVDRRIADGIDRAVERGLGSERAAAAFVDVSWAVGEHFYREAWARAIFANRSLDAEAKAARLYAAADRHLRQARVQAAE